jgi:hypothetical protein
MKLKECWPLAKEGFLVVEAKRARGEETITPETYYWYVVGVTAGVVGGCLFGSLYTAYVLWLLSK